MSNLIPIERIEGKIYLIRGQKVMLDHDLAELYGVKTFVLNQAVKRNIYRFPADFMFRLTEQEAKNLKSQIVMSNLKSQIATSSWGGRRYLPFAFSEQGIAMLSSVLNSERAIQVNILIIKTFVRLRKAMANHQELVSLLKKLESRVDPHDAAISDIVREIQRIIEVEEKPKGRIGFTLDD
jgi:phage regulator Rha-like protein